MTTPFAFLAKLLLFVILLAPYSSEGSPDEADALLLRISKALGSNHDGGIEFHVDLTNGPGSTKVERQYLSRVMNNQSWVDTLSPDNQSNKLFVVTEKGHTWLVRKREGRTSTLSRRDRLLGLASVGDIATINYYRNYSSKIEGDDEVDGVKYKILLLTAKDDKLATYSRVRMWVDTKRGVTVKSDFLTLHGEHVIKSAKYTYENQIKTKGEPSPFVSKMLLTNPKREKQVSLLIYQQPKKVDLDSKIFNPQTYRRKKRRDPRRSRGSKKDS